VHAGVVVRLQGDDAVDLMTIYLGLIDWEPTLVGGGHGGNDCLAGTILFDQSCIRIRLIAGTWRAGLCLVPSMWYIRNTNAGMIIVSTQT